MHIDGLNFIARIRFGYPHFPSFSLICLLGTSKVMRLITCHLLNTSLLKAKQVDPKGSWEIIIRLDLLHKTQQDILDVSYDTKRKPVILTSGFCSLKFLVKSSYKCLRCCTGHPEIRDSDLVAKTFRT